VQENTGGAGLHTREIQSAVDRVAMGGPIRLDLGAGHKHQDGWVRVDFDTDRKKCTMGGGVQEVGSALAPDVAADLRKLPFPDDYADIARAIHVIEHFQVWDAPAVLAEWVRVIKPGSALVIECPCLEKIAALFNVPNIPPYMTFWGLYGDPRLKDPLMMHHWCYSERQLAGLMQEAGLTDIRPEPPQFHQAARDMRLVGFKPRTEPRIQLAA
jgi:SAM-dependent methyltransferase